MVSGPSTNVIFIVVVVALFRGDGCVVAVGAFPIFPYSPTPTPSPPQPSLIKYSFLDLLLFFLPFSPTRLLSFSFCFFFGWTQGFLFPFSILHGYSGGDSVRFRSVAKRLLLSSCRGCSGIHRQVRFLFDLLSRNQIFGYLPSFLFFPVKIASFFFF